MTDAADGFMDAKDVTILWSETDGGAVARVVVTSAGARGHDGSVAIDDAERYPNSRGRVELGWMEGDHRQTPEGVFLDLLKQGFADRAGFEDALIEFGRICECLWARNLRRALGR